MNNYSKDRSPMSTENITQNVSFLHKGCVPLRLDEAQHLPWNNPHNIVSQRAEITAGVVRDLALAVLYLIGGPANVFNMAVFYKQGLEDRVNLCLFMLAFTDELYLTSCMFLHAENIYSHLSGHRIEKPIFEFMSNNNLIFLLGSAYVSYFLSAIISCERCYCVLSPLNYQTAMSTKTMAAIILVIYFLVLSLYFIVCYQYWIRCVFDPVTGEAMRMIIGGGLHDTHKEFIQFLDGVIFGAGLPGGVMIVVATSTIITTIKLRQIVSWRTEISSSFSAREVALTKMLIRNSVFFITCIFPVCAFPFIRLFFPGMMAGGKYHNFYLTTIWIIEISLFFNSSMNFFIYYTMGSKYRETFGALFGRRSAPQNAKPADR